VKTALGATDKVDTPLHPRLEEHKRYFEKHVGQLKEQAQRAILKHKKEIVERQLVVERLANMAIELYAAAATIARTQRLIDERGAAACERELALCDLFVVEAGRRFRASRIAIQSPQDETRRAVARHVRDAKGYGVVDALLQGDDGVVVETTPVISEVAR
jgi:alkylation response protein AidB-like acyl-CoA dehydrogenase